MVMRSDRTRPCPCGSGRPGEGGRGGERASLIRNHPSTLTPNGLGGPGLALAGGRGGREEPEARGGQGRGERELYSMIGNSDSGYP
jgi:hypothetical protein